MDRLQEIRDRRQDHAARLIRHVLMGENPLVFQSLSPLILVTASGKTDPEKLRD